MIIGVDDSLSSHADNHKGYFSVLGERSIDNINGYAGSAEKKFSMNFSEVKIEFCLSLPYNSHNIYIYIYILLMEKKFISLKPRIIIISTFLLSFDKEAYLKNLAVNPKKYH